MDGPATETSTWLRERIDGRLGGGVAVAWLMLLQVAFLLEPATNRPEPSYGVVLELVMWLLLATMVTGLVMQRRAGLVASLAAAGFLTMLSVACPVSGHHPFGAWWFGQMACALGMMGVSVAALSRSTHVDAAPTDEPTGDAEVPRISAGDAASRG